MPSYYQGDVLSKLDIEIGIETHKFLHTYPSMLMYEIFTAGVEQTGLAPKILDSSLVMTIPKFVDFNMLCILNLRLHEIDLL